jgi:lipopolysaccharide transport system ATP-binding protein
MFGLDFDEVNRLAPSIGDFSGLGDFLQMPVRTYSSGMMMRLVFAVVTSVRPEILIMDEWMAVGDADFMVHAEARLRELVDTAAILVLASHSEIVLNKHCNLIVTLEHGEIVGMDRVAT